MLIGVPAEIMDGETRVAITPETAKKLKAQGHADRKSTRLNSSHRNTSRMPSSA